MTLKKGTRLRVVNPDPEDKALILSIDAVDGIDTKDQGLVGYNLIVKIVKKAKT